MKSGKLYGHLLERSPSAEPIALSEASIVAEPTVLRHIARFLDACAGQLESERKDFGHLHLADFERGKFDLDFDVIVANPSD